MRFAAHANLALRLDVAKPIFTATTPTPSPSPVGRTRGLLSLPERVMKLYQRVDPADCTEKTIGNIGYAFDLGSVARFSSEVTTFTDNTQPWGGRFSGGYIDFEPAVSEKKALRILRRLLPADAKQTLRREGRNRYLSSKPESPCMTFNFTPAWRRSGGQSTTLLSSRTQRSYTLFTAFWEISERR